MKQEPPSDSRCSRCGAVLPSGAPGGHCPQCLIRTSLSGPTDDSEPAPDAPLIFLRAFGDYELLDEIARGGMGVVYRARQRSLNRIVAVKMLLAGEFASADFVRRFRREAEAAASLRHPNIVAIYEVGQQDGQHFFSMEFIEGRNLADLVRERPLPARRAASYLKAIAKAVAFAHERRTLHRDLKPSNILIDAFDQPRITDFGLAKSFVAPLGPASEFCSGVSSERRQLSTPESAALSRDGATESKPSEATLTGHALGSPAYMAPEQAAGRGAVGSAADLYSLGALLYHLITGRPPFQSDTIAGTLRLVQEEEPLPPRRLNPSIPADLQTICLKCLEKDPTRRYASAHELAEELGRFLRDEPIRARPVSAVERAWRWSRRRPTVAALSLTLLAAVLAGLAGVLWQWRRATTSEQEMRLNLYAADTRAAATALFDGDLGQARRLLALHQPRPGEADLRGFEWRYLWSRSQGEQIATLRGHEWIVTCAAFSPSGEMLATGSMDSTVKLWDVEGRQLIASISAHTGAVWSVAFTPEGDALVTAGSDGKVKFWDPRTHEVKTTFDGQQAVLAGTVGRSVPAEPRAPFDSRPRLSEDASPHLFHDSFGAREGDASETGPNDPAARRDGLALTSTAREQRAASVPLAGGAKVAALATQPMVVQTSSSAASSPFRQDAGSTLMALTDANLHYWGNEGGIALWNWRTGQKLRDFPERVKSFALSADGTLLAVASKKPGVRIWDAQRGELLQALPADAPTWSLNFSPDARQLTAAARGKVLVWDLASTNAPVELPHTLGVWSAKFSPDGRSIVTAASDRGIRFWDATDFQLQRVRRGHADEAWSVAFAPDGQTLASGGKDAAVLLWSLTAAKTEQPLPHGRWSRPLFAPDGRRVLTSVRTNNADQSIVWNLAGRSVVAMITNSLALGFSPDGTCVVRRSSRGPALEWISIQNQSVERTVELADARDAWPFEFAGASEDYKAGFGIAASGTIVVFDMVTGRALGRMNGPRPPIRSAALGPEARWFAVCIEDENAIRLFEVATGREIVLTGHRDHGSGLAFSPDGSLLASGSVDATIKLWEIPSGRERTTLRGHVEEATDVAFSPDGKTLASLGSQHSVKFWNVATRREVMSLPLPNGTFHLCFSPDGRHLAVTLGGRTTEAVQILSVSR